MNFQQLKKQTNNPFHKLYYEILDRFHVSDYAIAIAEMSPELRDIIESCKMEVDRSAAHDLHN